MAKIIDAQPMIEKIERAIKFGNEHNLPTDELEEVLKALNEAEEVVVPCENCLYYCKAYNYCNKYSSKTYGHLYCMHGRKKNREEQKVENQT